MSAEVLGARDQPEDAVQVVDVKERDQTSRISSSVPSVAGNRTLDATSCQPLWRASSRRALCSRPSDGIRPRGVIVVTLASRAKNQ